MTGEGIGQALLTGRLATEALLRYGSSAPLRTRSPPRTRGRPHGAPHSALARPAIAGAALRATGATAWTRRNFARWMFEDYPRAMIATSPMASRHTRSRSVRQQRSPHRHPTALAFPGDRCHRSPRRPPRRSLKAASWASGTRPVVLHRVGSGRLLGVVALRSALLRHRERPRIAVASARPRVNTHQRAGEVPLQTVSTGQDTPGPTGFGSRRPQVSSGHASAAMVAAACSAATVAGRSGTRSAPLLRQPNLQCTSDVAGGLSPGSRLARSSPDRRLDRLVQTAVSRLVRARGRPAAQATSGDQGEDRPSRPPPPDLGSGFG